MNPTVEEKPKNKGQQRFGNTNALGKNTLEDQISSWYTPPVLKTVLTEELVVEVAECFLDGLTDEETGDVCDVDPDTIRKWRRFGPIRKHETGRKRFYIKEIRDGKRRDWTRLAWWLERRYPLEFSRPEVAHEISLSHHSTVNTVQNLVISSELAEQLAQRNANMAEKIEQLFQNVEHKGRYVLQGEGGPSKPPPSSAGHVQAADLTNANKVRELATNSISITHQDDVSNPETASPLLGSEGATLGTPAVGGGPTTDQPQRTRKSKNSPELEIKKTTTKKPVSPEEKREKRKEMMEKILEKRKNAKISVKEHLAAKRKMILKYGQH